MFFWSASHDSSWVLVIPSFRDMISLSCRMEVASPLLGCQRLRVYFWELPRHSSRIQNTNYCLTLSNWETLNRLRKSRNVLHEWTEIWSSCRQVDDWVLDRTGSVVEMLGHDDVMLRMIPTDWRQSIVGGEGSRGDQSGFWGRIHPTLPRVLAQTRHVPRNVAWFDWGKEARGVI